MNSSILLILFSSSLIVLFSLYILSHEDFVLIRKNISVERIFNMAVIAFVVSFFFARFFYVLFNFNSKFLNPFTFFVFPYFPGLSLPAAVLGGSLFVLLYAHKHKMPVFRIFDFFLLSFLSVLPLGFLISYLPFLQKKVFVNNELFLLIIYILILFIFIKILLPRMQRGELKEGSLGFLVLIFFPLLSLIQNIIGIKDFINIITPDNIVLFLLLIFSSFFFLRQENIIRLKK